MNPIVLFPGTDWVDEGSKSLQWIPSGAIQQTINMTPESASENDSTTTKKVSICQSKTCSKQGGAKVLAAFEAHPVADVTIAASVCLGQCGQGPMVLVQPEKIWYNRVLPEEVPTIVEKHLRGGKPVKSMLYVKFHPPEER